MRQTTEIMLPVDSRVHILPTILGYAGLITFVVFAVSMWFIPASKIEIFDKALLTYAACILAFIGAIHWGMIMTTHANSRQLGLSVLPALLAWLALNIPFPWGYSILMIGFSCLCLADNIATHHNLLPIWYPRLCVPLTLVVVLSLISGSFGLMREF